MNTKPVINDKLHCVTLLLTSCLDKTDKAKYAHCNPFITPPVYRLLIAEYIHNMLPNVSIAPKISFSCAGLQGTTSLAAHAPTNLSRAREHFHWLIIYIMCTEIKRVYIIGYS